MDFLMDTETKCLMDDLIEIDENHPSCAYNATLVSILMLQRRHKTDEKIEDILKY